MKNESQIVAFITEMLERQIKDFSPNPNERDPLTNCKTSRAFSAALNTFLTGKGWDDKANFTLNFICFDVLHFKKINDEFGMQLSDEKLKGFSSLLMSNFGKEVVYRVGGEEFVVWTDNPTKIQDLNAIPKDLPFKFSILSLEGKRNSAQDWSNHFQRNSISFYINLANFFSTEIGNSFSFSLLGIPKQ